MPSAGKQLQTSSRTTITSGYDFSKGQRPAEEFLALGRSGRCNIICDCAAPHQRVYARLWRIKDARPARSVWPAGAQLNENSNHRSSCREKPGLSASWSLMTNGKCLTLSSSISGW
jgi:hypothetical protein